MQWPYHPNARGFDDFYGFCSGHWDNYFSPMLEHNGEIVSGHGFITDDLTDHAIDFIDKHRDQPCFVYLPYNTPHSPMQVPEQYWKKFNDKQLTPDPVAENANRQDLVHTRAALAMCENIDMNVGRMLQHLRQTGLVDHTIVVYFSDNGPNGYRFNGGMRGRKGSTHEGGLRSPCLIRYPPLIPAGSTVTPVAAAIDLLPTLTELAGLEFEPKQRLDGISIAPLLRQQDVAWTDRPIVSSWNQRATVRTNRWRWHSDGSLFDINADPGEHIDVSASQPSEVKILSAAIDEVVGQATDQQSSTRTDSPFTLGHPEATFTQLPARDGQPHGGVTRSNRFPNCTYMTHWKSTTDKITWNVEVLGAGTFEVQMYYASAGVGSQIELSLNDARIEATITEANAVAETGMEHDRFKRQEGYTKAWKPMSLGRMTLNQGRGTLTLRASKVVGDQVADMRLLMFRRVE